MDLSVVIPVYRSAETLSTLFDELAQALGELGVQWQIVLVDDASPDTSWDVICELQRRSPDRIRAIQLSRNFGQHNALMCGFRHADGRFIVTMDDDLQNPPGEIPKLFRAIRESNADLVYGAYQQKQHSRLRNLATEVVGAFYRKVFGRPFAFTAYRIFRRELMEQILAQPVSFVFIDGLFAWHTDRIARTVVEHRPRTSGRSRYTWGKLARLAVNLFTNFSLLPLQIASWVGGAVTTAGLVLALYCALQLLFGEQAIRGSLLTIVVVLVIGGIQLLCLGVLGEYVGRVHLNNNGRPQYAIRTILQPEPMANPSPDADDQAAKLPQG